MECGCVSGCVVCFCLCVIDEKTSNIVAKQSHHSAKEKTNIVHNSKSIFLTK